MVEQFAERGSEPFSGGQERDDAPKGATPERRWLQDKIDRVLGRFLPKGSFARSVLVLASGTAAGQLVVLLAAPLLTRLYTPTDFGVLAVYAAILGVISVVASLKYELAIPLPSGDLRGIHVLVVAVLTVIATSLGTALVIWILDDQIVRWTGTPALAPYLWLVPIGVFLVGQYQVWNYWAIRQSEFRRIAKTKLQQGAGSVATQVGLGLAGTGPLGLILGQIVGQAAGLSTLVRGALRKAAGLAYRIRRKGMIWALTRYRRFPLVQSWSALTNATGLRIPAVLMAALHGPEVAGWFVLAERVVGAPMKFVGSAVGQVYFNRVAEQRAEGRDVLPLYRDLSGRLLVFGFVALALVGLGGPQLFSLVLGGEWGAVGTYVRILAVMFLVQFVVGPISQTLVILEKQGVKLWWESGRLSAICVAFGISWLAGFGPEGTLAAYAALSAGALAALYFLSGYWVRREQAGDR